MKEPFIEIAGKTSAAVPPIETRLLEALKSVVPGKASLHEPLFSGNEARYVAECVETGWVSSVGKFVDRIERDLAACTGVAHAVATVNGTAALHLSLKLAGVEPGDEVIVPALTFVATANAVAHCGATPHFGDSDATTLGLSASALEAHLSRAAEVKNDGAYNRATGRRIKALVVVHVFGHPADVEGLSETCRRFNLEFIEDAAESLGSFYKGRHTGHWGRLAAFSFNGNKIVTTGGGGAILTNDPALAKLAKHLSTTAKVAHPWAYGHDRVGYNYRMPNLNAALGCAQIEKLPEFVEKKRTLAARYEKALATVRGVRFVREPDGAKSNYWLNAVLLDAEAASRRDVVLEALNEGGLMARPAWTLMHKLPMYEKCPRAPLPVAEDLEARLVNIPSSAFL